MKDKWRVIAGRMLGVLPVAASRFSTHRLEALIPPSLSNPVFPMNCSTTPILTGITTVWKHVSPNRPVYRTCCNAERHSGIFEKTFISLCSTVTTSEVMRSLHDNKKMSANTCWFSTGPPWVPILFVKDRNAIMKCLSILCVGILLQEFPFCTCITSHDVT